MLLLFKGLIKEFLPLDVLEDYKNKGLKNEALKNEVEKWFRHKQKSL